VLAILTVDGSGEGHQQEKTKETKTDKLMNDYDKPKRSALREMIKDDEQKAFPINRRKSTLDPPSKEFSTLINKQTLIHRDCSLARLRNKLRNSRQ